MIFNISLRLDNTHRQQTLYNILKKIPSSHLCE